MASTLDTLPIGQRAILVTVEWSAQTVRWARWQDDVVISGNTFTALEKMEVTIPRKGGGVSSEDAYIVMISSVEPWATYGDGKAHAFMTVTIQEVEPDDLTTLRTLFKGQVTNGETNYNGTPGLIRVTAGGIKGQADVSLGILCGSGCAWNFGDQMCGVSLAPIRASFLITAITDAVITVPSLTPLQTSRWSRGYVTYDGLNLAIRKYSGGTQMELLRVPPAAWLNKTAVFTPGCVKDVAACQFWSNVARYGGFGFKMVSYDPFVQEPP